MTPAPLIASAAKQSRRNAIQTTTGLRRGLGGDTVWPEIGGDAHAGITPAALEQPRSTRLRAEAARTSRPADPRAYRTGPLSRRADRAGAQRPARAVSHLWRCPDRGRPGAGLR